MTPELFWIACLLFCLAATGNCHSDNVDTRLADLEERLTELIGHVEQLEERDKLSQIEIRSLKSELRKQKQKADTFERLVSQLRIIKQDGGEENVKQTDTEKIPGETDEGSGSIHSRIGAPETQRERRQQNEQTIAFYATLTNSVVHAGPRQNIIFDHVITNVGSAYSDSLGAFVAPVSGVYVFSVWLTTYGSQTEHYVVSKNNNIVSYMYARGDTAPYMVTGQTAILNLSKGDNIEIQTRDSDGSLHGSHYSSFAGFLLQQDYSAPVAVGK